MILSVINHGYYLPFVEEPSPVFLCNHASAIRHRDFVESAIMDLLKLNPGSSTRRGVHLRSIRSRPKEKQQAPFDSGFEIP